MRRRRFMFAILQGVASGLIIAIILGAYQWGERHMYGREQIRHLRDIVSVCYKELEVSALFLIGVSPELRRFTIFKSCIERLENSIEYRSPQINHKKKYELKLIVSSAKQFLASRQQDENPPASMNFYIPTFVRLKNLPWMGLTDQDLSLPKGD